MSQEKKSVINTRKYIESFIKIRDKNSDIIPLKLNKPQQKLYDIIKEQKQQGRPVRIIILKARQRCKWDFRQLQEVSY